MATHVDMVCVAIYGFNTSPMHYQKHPVTLNLILRFIIVNSLCRGLAVGHWQIQAHELRVGRSHDQAPFVGLEGFVFDTEAGQVGRT
jgi:hypothetical protein